MQVSLMYPAQPDSAPPAVKFARYAQDQGVTRMWIGQALRVESYIVLAAVASQVPGLSLGTSVALTPLRHPYQAAVDARAIAALSGTGFVAGYGPGGTEFQEALLGAPLARPVAHTEEYAGIMRKLLDGGHVRHEGEHFRMNAQLLMMPAPAVEIGLGVLRPAMARAAGRVADVAVTWLTPHWYLAEQIGPALRDGAASRERATPRIASVVHIGVTRRGRDPRKFVLTAVGQHLRAPHYTAMLRAAGVDVDPQKPVQGAEMLLDSGVFVTGSPEEIAASLVKHHESGIDEIILSTCGVHFVEGEAMALADLTDVLAVLRDG